MPRLDPHCRLAVRVICTAGQIDLTDRDRIQQLDGRLVRAVDLTAQHTVPGLGRIRRTVRLQEHHLIDLHRVRPISNPKP